ncbi:MAG: hypothetical protein AAF702_12755 [Chloroflexota bacterium]
MANELSRRRSIDTYRFGSEDKIHGFMATLFRLTRLGLTSVIGIYSFAQPFYPYLAYQSGIWQ